MNFVTSVLKALVKTHYCYSLVVVIVLIPLIICLIDENKREKLSNQSVKCNKVKLTTNHIS